jgi:prevent-host-death family protein
MKTLRAEDIIPIGEFRSKTPQYLGQLAEHTRPLVLTSNGKPVAVMLTPAEFDRLVEERDGYEALAAGFIAERQGRVSDFDEVRKRLEARSAARTERGSSP